MQARDNVIKELQTENMHFAKILDFIDKIFG